MGVLRMIEALNANSKVGKVFIRLSSNNRWNDEIVKLIIDRYTSVYLIFVDDFNS